MASLLISNGADADAIDANGASPLHYAAMHNHSDTVQLVSYLCNLCNSKVSW